jgi:5-methylthioadenosine/S-adenosylhomocysteine deaminase
LPVLIRNARVLTMDDAGTEHARADVLVEGTRIAAVGPDLEVPPALEVRLIDGTGHLVMPGLINGHLHSPGNFMKGATDDTPLEVFMLYEVPPLSQAPESPRLYYLRTLLGAVEMLKLGVTAVHDDAFFNPVPTPEAIDAVMEAYRDAGMRAAVTLDQPNVVEYEKYPFLYDVLPPPLRAEMEQAPRLSADELLELYRAFIDRWHGSEEGRLACAVSCSAPQRVTVSYLEALTALSHTYDLPFDVHILETRLQRVLGQEKYGKSLIRYVHDLGLLDERKMVIHAIWVDRADIELLAASGCTVAHNPISNLKIGSGVMPFRALRDAGIPICLGSDEASVDDTANMWGVAKVAGLVHKIGDPEYRHWPRADEILDCLIRGGARAMRIADRVGQIAPGYAADLILLDLDTIAFTPLNDLKRQLVFCESGTSVALTMVQGRIVAEHGRILTVDERALRTEIRGLMAEHHAVLELTRAHARKLEPYYREMYLRALATPVPMQRWVPTFT